MPNYDPFYARPLMISGWSTVHVWGTLACVEKSPLMRVDEEVLATYPEAKFVSKPKPLGERYSHLMLFQRLSLCAAELAREGWSFVVEDNSPNHISNVAERTLPDLGTSQQRKHRCRTLHISDASETVPRPTRT